MPSLAMHTPIDTTSHLDILPINAFPQSTRLYGIGSFVKRKSHAPILRKPTRTEYPVYLAKKITTE
jgi:hypothetical protein